MKKECREKKRISVFMDEELSAKDMKRVEAHLKTCSECRKEADAVQSLNNLFRKMKEVEPSDNFAKRFWQKMDAARTRKFRWDVINPLTWGWQPSVVATAAVILIVGGIVLLQKTPHFLFGPMSDAEFDKSSDITTLYISEDLDFYVDMEIVSQLDMFENWDAINRIEEI